MAALGRRGTTGDQATLASIKARRRFSMYGSTVVYLGLAVLMAIVAMQTQLNFLFWVFGVMMSGLVLSALVGGMMMMGLRVHRRDPHHGAVGEPLTIRYRLHNRLPWMAVFNVHIEELPVRSVSADERSAASTAARPWQRVMKIDRAWVMHIAPRERSHAEVVFWPKQRGRVRFDRVRVWTTFPFGILRRSLTITQTQHTLVFPMLYRLRSHVLQSFSPTGPCGMRMTTKSGSGDEYFGVREYQSGESMRNISWKLTARRDELMCIERTAPSPPRIRVILNLTRTTEDMRVTDSSPIARRELQERAISLAASIIHAASSMDYEVGLSIAGSDHPTIAIRRSRWHLGRMMSALASIDLDHDPAAREWIDRSDLERAGQVFVHPDRVDPSLGRDDALHFSATQLDRLTDGPLGWDPTKMPSVIDGTEPIVVGVSAPGQESAA